ncbi:MAG: YbaY family lipoprotein [Chloroflexi bacterium]|nr:YbaY family lipoprotein [Chloroflexota bacterium]
MRLPIARWALVLAGAALLVAAALDGPARPLLAQESGEPLEEVATDRAALMALYAATDGPNWTNDHHWGSGEPLGLWDGVTADAQGRVIRLILSGNNLVGTLPPELGNLANLQLLWLGQNQLSGPLPSEWGRLINLEHLALARNRLIGPLPGALGDLVNLEHLDLGYNQLSGPLPPEWGQLASLEYLDLSYNQLSGPLPPQWGQLTALRNLQLHVNHLNGPLPPEWDQLTNLGLLYAGGNRLTGPLPAEWSKLPRLTSLGLSGNRLTGPLPTEWSKLAGLTSLGLGGNQLSGPIPPGWGILSNLYHLSLAPNPGLSGCIPYGWRYLVAGPDPWRVPRTHDLHRLALPFCLLRDLRLRGTTLDPPFAGGTAPHAAPRAYTAGVAASITETAVTATLHDPADRPIIRRGGRTYASGEPLLLDLGPNRITIMVTPADTTFPIAEVVVVTVTRGPAETPEAPDPADVAADRAALLALYDQTDGPNWTADSNWGSDAPLRDWHGVTIGVDGRVGGLALAGNNLTGTLPSALGDLGSLTELDLGDNRLQGAIPEALGNLTDLESLSLDGNELSGPIPVLLHRLRNLRELDLSGNRFSGVIPAWVDMLVNLTDINLAENRLRGLLPTALGRLADLETLDLGGNLFWGLLPAAWNALANLESLSLAGNRLRGPLPAAWGELVNLGALDLSGNRLEGPLPAAWAELTNLEALSLAGNGFRGPLPAAWGELVNLEALDLSGNQLEGPLPPWLGALADLEVLDLSNNRLYGPIPASLGNLTGLWSLSLAENRLGGPVPAALGDLSGLRFIRLAGNALQGCLPYGLHDLLAAPEHAGLPAHDFSALRLPFCLLRDLRLADATLESPFAADRGTYIAAVNRSVTEAALMVTLQNANDAVTIHKGGESYSNGAPLPLDLGPNRITITVIPVDGTPLQNVTVTLIRLATDPISLDLRAGGDLVVVPAGAATTAADLFGETDVASVWKYTRATRAWDRSYLPALETGDFPIVGGDVLWVVSPVEQTLPVAGRPPPASPVAGPITLDLQAGGDLVVVPAGTPTTAAALFDGTDVAVVWQYNRATRAWDRAYLPALGTGDFPIAPGDVLWVVAPRALTVTAGAPAAAVTGRVYFGGGEVTLPEGAVVTVRLLDTSLADAPSTTLGEQIIRDAGRLPLAFRVGYDPAAIMEGYEYSLQATVRHDGRLLYINDTVHPVLTRGAPRNRDIEVIRVQ